MANSYIYTEISGCRSCGNKRLISIINFGKTPLADALLKEEQVGKPEIIVPLSLVFCPECSLVQLNETVNPQILFCRNYPYFSSTSKAYLDHSKKNADELIKLYGLNSDSLVIEPACNDGYMLKNFSNNKIKTLGIDPAKKQLKVAESYGIKTICGFFDDKLAIELQKLGLQADVFIANNVLAHVPNLNGFVEGIRIILKETGVASIEVPYIADLIDKCEFDTIYHQHLCYFSLTALDSLFKQHSLYINKVKHLPIHGGSLRIYVEHYERRADSVLSLLKKENYVGLRSFKHYKNFAEHVNDLCSSLIKLLYDLKNQGKKLVGYGAAAKANTLLSYCGIDRNLLDYIVDLNEFKQGLYMGGNNIPIYPTTKLLEDIPDFVLLLTWNFKTEILDQQQTYRQHGGKFIIPIPNIEII